MLSNNILKDNLDDIPDGFKRYNLSSYSKPSNYKCVDKKIEDENKENESAEKINNPVDSSQNQETRLNSDSNKELDLDTERDPNSDKIIFLLILFLLCGCK